MSGHNKWSTIKHKKARADAQRSKSWTKIVRELIVSARDGGGDPEFNPSLRLAVQKAKAANMPKDNIDRAIKRGAGGEDGTIYDELYYEGYGPGGVAMLVKVLTDNKNRTVAEVRSIFAKNGGAMGESGSVAWQFDAKGVIGVSAEGLDEDTVMMDALEAGAEDVELDGESFQITTDPKQLHEVMRKLEAAGYSAESAELTRIPQNLVPVDEKVAQQVMRIYSLLEENDDVQAVYFNADIDEETAAQWMA